MTDTTSSSPTNVVTRFAPSPTGYLHIGGARTALFNWLFARNMGGKFLLRIEDTDKERNNADTVQPIIDGLKWLGLDHDGSVVFQSNNRADAVHVTERLLERGAAYRCYMSEAETEAAKFRARKTGMALRSPWRDLNAIDPVGDIPFTVRLKMPDSGETVIDDIVQGLVTVQNTTLDDMILLRADGSPVYMLASVVDDYADGITHVIRGDDHLNNAFRQLQIYRAMGWPEPRYAHIPLIHNEKGQKLSKRDGAVGVEWYRDAGYLSDAVFNYLLRMGWGHGDHEIFSRDEAIKLFNLDGVGKAPARLDLKRLEHLNGVYIRDCPMGTLADALDDYWAVTGKSELNPAMTHSILPLLKERSKTLEEIDRYIEMVVTRPSLRVDDVLLSAIHSVLPYELFTADAIKARVTQLAETRELKLKHVVAPLRLAITGSKISPPLFETMALLGEEECQARINFAIHGTHEYNVSSLTGV